MSFTLQLNGNPRDFAKLTPPVTLAQLVAELQLKGDRIAVELNGAIIERTRWPDTLLNAGDRLEVVHFVGGGKSTSDRPDRIYEAKDAGLGNATAARFPAGAREFADMEANLKTSSFSRSWYVIKGGSFSPHGDVFFASYLRRGFPSDQHSPVIGFRCVRDVSKGNILAR